MPQIINTNIASLNAQRNLDNSQKSNDVALQRLSSGLRINSAKDDAAGLAISTRFDTQIRGTSVAIRNAGDGVSLSQLAEGSLGSMETSLQRIRELALQSANGTNGDLERQALNDEAQQLIEEVTRTAETTNFNGTNLLDGTFSSQFQVGANVGETISVEISKVTADTLGASTEGGLSALSNINALGNGDLSINGVSVGPSVEGDDSASTDAANTSAIAKAAAINKVSDESGVTAVVDENLVAGTSMTADAGTTTLTLNNVAISLTTTSDAATSRASVIAAINEFADQTGVTAVDSGSDTSGINLVAADGRNIQVSMSSGGAAPEFATDAAAAAATGLALSATYNGGFTLVANAGVSEIVIAGGDGTGLGDIANSGLEVGTYTAGEANLTSIAQTVGSGGTVASLTDGDMQINGVAIAGAKATDDTASAVTASDASTIATSIKTASGISVAATINASSDATGVTAEVQATVVTGGDTGAAAAFAGEIGTVYINGVATSAITSVNSLEDDRTSTINAINEISGQTGVVAEDNGRSITLTAADGRNISVAVDTNTATNAAGVGATATFAAAIGLDAAAQTGIGAADITGTAATIGTTSATTYSAVVLNSAGEIKLEAGSNGSFALEDLGFEVGTFGGAASGQFLKDVDISTIEGANKAIAAIDNALNTISSERASLGAIQNRFESTISSLQVSGENLSAANSRIRDADFAAETAALARSQVLMQAGISVLSQANARPQQVLSLLQ